MTRMSTFEKGLIAGLVGVVIGAFIPETVKPDFSDIHFGAVNGEVIPSHNCEGSYYGAEESPLTVKITNTTYSKVTNYAVSIQTTSGKVTGPAYLAFSEQPIEPRSSITMCLPNGLNGPYSSIGWNKSDNYSVDIEGVTYQ